MVFEPNFKKVVSSTRKNIGITQVVVEAKLPLQDAGVNAVYSVGAKSTILSHEVSNGSVDFNGLVDMQVVYLGDRGVASLDYSAEFKDKYVAGDAITGELIVGTNVVDVTSQIVGGGINVVAIVEIVFDEIKSKDINVLVSVEGDSVYKNYKSIEFTNFIGKAYEKFDISHELNIKDAKNILMVTPCVSLSKVEPKDNYLVLQGVLGLDICYSAGDNVNDIGNLYDAVDFSWEVALSNISCESIIESVVSIVSNEIKVSTSIDESGANLSLYVPVVYNGYVFNKERLQVVDDVYLEDYYLSVTTENFDTLSQGNGVCFRDGISGVAGIKETAPFIDEVVGVTATNLVLARSVVEDGVLVVEGVATTSVIYYTKETNELTSIQVEMPFMVEENVAQDNASVVTLCLNKLNARSRRGKEIEVSAELCVYADTYSVDGVNIISDIALASSKPIDDCSLCIYIVKPNQTLWDIAKELGVSQELILEQNSDIEFPLKAGEKLVVYRPKVINF